MLNVVVVAENEEACKLLNYLVIYRKLMGAADLAFCSSTDADVPVDVLPRHETGLVKARAR